MRSLSTTLAFFFATVSWTTYAQAYDHPKDLVINGHMNPDEVAKTLQARVAGITNVCFESLLKKNEHAQGTLTIAFEVPKMKTKAIRCKIHEDQGLSDEAFKACVVGKACGAEFPAPTLDTEILYPMTFFKRGQGTNSQKRPNTGG